MVVDDGVDEAGADDLSTFAAHRTPRGGSNVLVSLLPPNQSPPAAVRDLAEFLHIDVDHRAGFVVLVAADRVPSFDIDMMQPVESTADQNRMDCRGQHAHFGADRDRPE